MIFLQVAHIACCPHCRALGDVFRLDVGTHTTIACESCFGTFLREGMKLTASATEDSGRLDYLDRLGGRQRWRLRSFKMASDQWRLETSDKDDTEPDVRRAIDKVRGT